MPDYDVIVVGAGNAALAASVAAREAGARRVLVLEKAARDTRGGNTHFSGGLFRFAFETIDDLLRIVPKAGELEGFREGIVPYPRDAFRADLMRVTQGRTDPELSEILIANSYDTVRWMTGLGVEMEPAVSLGGIRVGNVIHWPRGAVVRAAHEGVGLSASWFKIAARRGVEILYDTGATGLMRGGGGRAAGGRVAGVVAGGTNGVREITAKAVVLGCGGFEGNVAWRSQYLGRPWDNAKVRGSKHNQGDGLRMALDAGAVPHGQWTGCHGTPIDANASAFGDRKLTDKSNRLSYPYGVMINKLGLRFLDEGEDQQFFTYAKFGGIILGQPNGIAYQIFDSKVTHLLEPRYAFREPFSGESFAELVGNLDVDRETALQTLNDYNAAAGHGEFNPAELDGMGTKGLRPPKSNWAQRLDAPPYHAYPVTGGITFSFGGLKINDHAQVIGTNWKPILGLYTCGEMVGGLFYYNYPGGTGLMSGAVFGRIAGAAAARE